MIVVLLLLHEFLAVALLGAITHQALSVLPLAAAKGQRTFIDRFRGVNAPAYATPIVVLFVLTAIGGALLYPQYRIDVRPALEDMQNAAANGVFEIKEHLIVIGLGLLPAYWQVWQQPFEGGAEARSCRAIAPIGPWHLPLAGPGLRLHRAGHEPGLDR